MTFTVRNPAPALSGLSPNSATAGEPAFTLIITGTDLVDDSTVYWNEMALTTTFVSTTQLTAMIPAANIAVEGIFSVTVANPGPGGGMSNAMLFTVTGTPSHLVYLPFVVRN